MRCHAVRVVTLLIIATILLFATVANAGAEKPPGVIVDYSPPSTGIYLGDPSIAILPNGHYIVSHDAWGPSHSYSRTYLFGSTDKGITWKPITSLAGQYQSSLFVHKGALYLIGAYGEFWGADEFGAIRRSTDGGKTWTQPVDANTGLITPAGRYNMGATPAIVHNGRIFRAMEKVDPNQAGGDSREFRPFMASAPVGSDLLKASNWTISNSLLLHDFVPGLGFFEGNAVVTPNGNMVIILRTAYRPEKATIIQVSQDGRTISFDPKTGFVDFPGGGSQFTIRYDKQTNRYWSLVNTRNTPTAVRNFLSLVSSADLINWSVEDTILEHPDSKKVAWQYVDLRFEGDDIIFASRTAFGGAANFHDNNYITFHRIKDFRRYHRPPQRLTSRPTPATQRLRPTLKTKPTCPSETTTQKK